MKTVNNITELRYNELIELNGGVAPIEIAIYGWAAALACFKIGYEVGKSIAS